MPAGRARDRRGRKEPAVEFNRICSAPFAAEDKPLQRVRLRNGKRFPFDVLEFLAVRERVLIRRKEDPAAFGKRAPVRQPLFAPDVDRFFFRVRGDRGGAVDPFLSGLRIRQSIRDGGKPRARSFRRGERAVL